MILVVGSQGMLGRDMVSLLGSRGRGVDLPDCDITCPDSVERIVGALKPQVVINCAAYTDVDGCEINQELARRVNALGVTHLAETTRKIGATLVQISTDYVFDGAKGSPYVEDDLTCPLSVYGHSKRDGELHTVANPDYLIVRTQWLYGIHGKNFVETMLRLASEKDLVSVVDDQIGSPTWTVDLAAAILALLDNQCRGIYHVANSGFCSWNGFARAIFEETASNVTVASMTTRELNRPAQRPLYSTLDCTKLMRDAGFSPRPWREALQLYLHQRTV